MKGKYTDYDCTSEIKHRGWCFWRSLGKEGEEGHSRIGKQHTRVQREVN